MESLCVVEPELHAKASRISEVAEVENQVASLRAAVRRVGDVVRGKEAVVRLAMMGMLARGHVLLEDVPGVGKTTLARALAKIVGGSFCRIQLTADLLPADIIGGDVLDPVSRALMFRPGPIFGNVVLADELNRATPRTQSGLLEAMAERSVSVGGKTYSLPEPFFVIATQNPTDHFGVYALPQSQMDRFVLRSSIGYPSSSIEADLIAGRSAQEPIDVVDVGLNPGDLMALSKAVDRIALTKDVATYIQTIVQATREAPDVLTGVSTRGALQFARVVRAQALIDGRSFVTPDDVRGLAAAVCGHRLVLKGREFLGANDAQVFIDEIVSKIPVPV